MEIINPILRGFNPDPSILRVGEDYYIATSTFEYFPGVQIHHSRDLAHWRLLTRPLNRVSQLDLRGVGASQGVWAPDLSFWQGTYYLLYTLVTSFYCNMYDTHNYMVTATDIRGPWSQPIRLNGYGFDPSLFHDTDGCKYVLSMVTDHRIPKKYAGRLVLQQLDAVTCAPLGAAKEIYAADPIYLEGPHLYRHEGLYYLFAADTGTGEGHGQSVLRSASVWGPYEMYHPSYAVRTDPREAWSMLTARHAPDHPLQKAGHADLVQTQTGEWYAVHLCGRPGKQRNAPDAPRFPNARRYPLGRETALQRITWAQGWPVLANGTALPDVTLPAPALPPHPWPLPPAMDHFDAAQLDIRWQTLRLPLGETELSLTERPGHLRLFGGDGLSARGTQSMVLQRVTEPHCDMETVVSFEPTLFKQMAGMILWYDSDNYIYLHLTHDEQLGKVVTLLTAENKRYAYPAGFVPILSGFPVRLRMRVRDGDVCCSFAVGQAEWQPIGDALDVTFLSDEACNEGWFTGTMTGLCCQDLTGSQLYADFDAFWYQALPLDTMEAR